MKQGVTNWKSFQAFEALNLKGEEFTKPSLTIPGMTLSMRQLLDKYVRGHDVTVLGGGYDSDIDDLIPPGFEHMTEQDKLDAARALKVQQGVIRERIKFKQDATRSERPDSVPPGGDSKENIAL